MTTPKQGGASLERDPQPGRMWIRKLTLWNTRRKPAAQQWLNEDGIRALHMQCEIALKEIDADREEAGELARQILANRREN